MTIIKQLQKKNEDIGKLSSQFKKKEFLGDNSFSRFIHLDRF